MMVIANRYDPAKISGSLRFFLRLGIKFRLAPPTRVHEISMSIVRVIDIKSKLQEI